MDISSLKNFNIQNFAQTKINMPFFGLKLQAPIQKDTVSFTGGLQNFKSKQEAVEHYKNVGKEVMASLEEEDDLTAFETLGYDVDSDFETDKITINGDYKPFFEITCGERLVRAKVSYKEAGIDEERLLQNVEKITGKRYVSGSFEPDDNFEIDKTITYPKEVGKKLDTILAKRVLAAKMALQDKDDIRALKLLGYNAKTDENGKITLDDGYSHILLRTYDGNKNLNDYNIDENELLRNVTVINGEAEFSGTYKPDHYIKTDSITTFHMARTIKKQFVELSPEFMECMDTVKKALDEGDNLKALNALGFKAEADENGDITINGDYSSNFQFKTKNDTYRFTMLNCGIDEEKLLQNVKKVKGDLDLHYSTIEKLNKDIEVDGIVRSPFMADDSKFFEDFTSPKEIGKAYNMPASVIVKFGQKGIVNPSVKTSSCCYFNKLSNEDKEFLEDISKRRDEILTFDELRKKYETTSTAISNAARRGELVPYKINDDNLYSITEDSGYMFDITDEANSKAFKRFALNKKSRLLRENGHTSSVQTDAHQASCLRNSVKCQYENSTKAFHASDLERLGYGSKADLIASCGLRVNAYETRQYILNNDIYDISNSTMTDILLNSRHQNPALIKVKDLRKLLGNLSSRNAFLEGVEANKMNFITQNAYRLTNYNDFLVDLSDGTNLEFLRTINNESFQLWLEDKTKEIKAYREENAQKLEEFKARKAPTKKEEEVELRREFETLQKKRKEQEKQEKLRIQQRKDEASRNLSLRNTIAWVLCPKTRQVRQENLSSHVKAIFAKSKEAEKIHQELLAKEITIEEAQDRLKELHLSKQDEIDILSYHKNCWEISGTEEWTEALKQAKEISRVYKESGLDAIENESVKERLIAWEGQWGKNEE